ncbi:MAG: response regulator [Lachnospiraceae bacterium]|nr:response regulator [Lachnospiraceae bacterium]
MSQYSILFVDDEEEVFQIILRKLDWESLEFSVPSYARNGREALELAEELQPDVVMTDIKMPYMDGLELGRQLKQTCPQAKIVIFSGFDRFEYAQEAIKLEVEEYILKPIDADELRSVFQRLREKLDRERAEKRDIDKLHQYYMESLPVLQDSLYTSLIEGCIPQEEINRLISSYQIDLPGPYYAVCLVHASAASPNLEIEPFLLSVSVKKLAEEQLVERWRGKLFTYLDNTVLIAQLTESTEVTSLTDSLDRFCRLARHLCGATVTIGIGQVCSSLRELSASYTGAVDALSCRVIYGNTRAINIAEISPLEITDNDWNPQFLQQVFQQIKTGSRENLEQAVHRCVRQVSGQGNNLQKYRLFLMELLMEFFRFGSNNQLNVDKIWSESRDIYNEALHLESPEELEQWLLALCAKLQELVAHRRQNTTRSFVGKAVDYVREHYADQSLSVEMVCRSLGVSTSYFSTVFKKETGKTFIGYLTDYRMEQAVQLLLEGDEKTYVIAGKLGYSDPNYFSYVFKKQFGVSPTRYRVRERNKA